jgi:putative ABC transport system ATP-binding protein
MKKIKKNKAPGVIRLEKVSRFYGEGETRVKALDRVSLEIHQGEFTAVVGPSGSGKTTLLNLIGGLDKPSEGRIWLAQKELSSMSGAELSDFRRDHLGFIFQSYNLIPVLTVSENVEYVLLLQGVGKLERRKRTEKILREVGLLGKENRFPHQLSGGQQQRVAVARAMLSEPDLILADEPTANLDSASGAALLDLMRRLNEKHGRTFLFSTHDRMVMERAKRLVTVKDGRVVKDEIREK